MTAKDGGEGASGRREAGVLGLRCLCGEGPLTTKAPLKSVSIIPESFSFSQQRWFLSPSRGQVRGGKELAIDSVLQC